MIKTLHDFNFDQDKIREHLIVMYTEMGAPISTMAREIGISYSSLYGFMAGKRLSRICLLKVESKVKEWANQ
jgi:hypothetical protein